MAQKFVWVDGVRIELTPDQLSFVAKENARNEKELDTFHKTLLHYGFKKFTEPKLEYCYLNEEHGWFAEIHIHNKNWIEVWLTGKLLPTMSAPPGGRMYGDVKEIKKVIDKALSNPKLWEVERT